MQFLCKVVLHAIVNLLQLIVHIIQSPEIEKISLKYRSELLPSCTESNQHVPLCEQSIRWYKRRRSCSIFFFKKEAPLLVYYCQGLTQSMSPSSASDMAKISSARSTAYPLFFLFRTSPQCFTRRSTSMPWAQSDRIPVLPVSCVRRRSISPKVDSWQLAALLFHIWFNAFSPAWL